VLLAIRVFSAGPARQSSCAAMSPILFPLSLLPLLMNSATTYPLTIPSALLTTQPLHFLLSSFLITPPLKCLSSSTPHLPSPPHLFLPIPAQAGERYAALGDWSEASASLKRSMEGFRTVCGKKDKRASDVAKMLTVSSI
jgi:hypothetical protein